MTTKPSDTGDTSSEMELASTEASHEVPVDDGIAQWAFTAPFEGIVDHLYLDTKGNVTCGVGFLIPNREALDRYDWRPDILTARGDYDRVRAAKPGQLARAYEKLCQATLTADTMRVHFDAHVQMVMGQLSGTWKLSELPRPVRVALVVVVWAVLVTVIWDDVHMRQFVRDCDASGGRVVVSDRAIACVGARP